MPQAKKSQAHWSTSVTGRRKRIEIFEQHCAVDLVTQADNNLTQDSLHRRLYSRYKGATCDYCQAKSVVLASGGASKAYLYTSNPDGASGDGLAMAWRRGCRVANLEFNQFHPTCLYHPKAKSFLITEALRGEGAMLQAARWHAALWKTSMPMPSWPQEMW